MFHFHTMHEKTVWEPNMGKELQPNQTFILSNMGKELQPNQTFIPSNMGNELQPNQTFIPSNMGKELQPNQTFIPSNMRKVLQPNQTSIPSCTLEDQHRVRPKDVTKKRYGLVIKGEEVAAYIVTELHKYGVPVTLLFGTALYEYRNGTGNCVQAYFKEDDFDIGVFSKHFHYVVSLIDKIEEKFGWKAGTLNDFIYFHPPGQRPKKGFQVDVYRFVVDQPRIGLVDFVWDNIRIEKNALLPLEKHKPVVSSNVTVTTNNGSVPFYYMPHNIHCYLANLYGKNFMTPQPGFKVRDGEEPSEKHNNPPCH